MVNRWVVLLLTQKIDHKITSNSPILIVDDDDDQLEISQQCYEMSNLENPLLLLKSGQELLEYMRAVEQGNKLMPELILLDINMPIMTGLEVLNELRKHPYFKKIPYIWILTNSQSPMDKDKSERLGANGYLVKPYHIADYIKLFNSMLT